MSESSVEKLESRLEQLLGQAIPSQAVSNINAAMELAGILETKGFTFQLKDMCPKSLTETRWCATFLKEESIFSAESPQSFLAVCMAAADALGAVSGEKS